jgi:uncharacterized beta-barrel protein YwiB (DUF1934 family)
MDKPVIISIKGMQSYEDQNNEPIELITEGRLAGDLDSGYTLSYQESHITGLEGTLTTFQIEKGRITLLRVGEVNSQMVFEEGRKHLSMYETPYGALTVGVNTHKAHSNIGEAGGDIEINYAIEIDHAVAGENFFQINVRESASRIKQ